MEKQIKLFYNYGKYIDGSKIISTEENIDFTLDYERPPGSKLYFCASNGSIIRKGNIENNKFTLDADFIKLGRLSLKIELEFLGNIVKSFIVEDLIVQELDEHIEIIPQLVEMENKIKELTEMVEVLKDRLDFFVKLWKEGL